MMNDIFTYFPRIETEHLLLRQIQISDAAAMFALFSDKEVVDLDDKRLNSLEEAQEFIGKLQAWYKRRENVEWGITLKGGDQLIGGCGFYGFTDVPLAKNGRHAFILS